MKAKYYILAPIIVIVLILAGCDSDNSEDNSEEAARLEKERQNTKKIQELCSKYNAVTDWKQHFHKKAFGQHTYTIEVEDALIRPDGRPILFTYPIHDIVRESDKCLVYFYVGSTWDAIFRRSNSLDYDFFRSCDVHFVLDCTEDQVKQIINHPAGRSGDYAVIAQISEVEKVRFKLGASSMGYEDVSVDLETFDTFMAKGKCLDLLFVVGKVKRISKNNK